MARMTKETTRQLDAEIARMTNAERNELYIEGDRMLRPDKAWKAEYMRNYMPKYKARIALAARKGLTQAADNAGWRGAAYGKRGTV